MEPWLERYRGILFFGLIVIALAAVVLFQALRPSSEPIMLSTSTPVPSPEATSTPRPVRVYVSGAVQQPDVYTLLPDSIVKDAVMAAGGAAGNADLDRINLASPVTDGQQIYVPRQGEESPPVQPPSAQRSSDFRVNINTADATTLQTLPGIGPKLAQRILDYRAAHGPFARTQDIMEVSGIGQATFEELDDQITTE